MRFSSKELEVLSAAGIDRRQLLRGGLGLGALAALAACGSSSSTKTVSPATTGAAATSGAPSASAPASAAAKSFGTLDYRLSWIKNVEFAGTYIADTKGYFTQQGFSTVNLISGGPTATPQETDVVTGKALLGLSSPDATASAIVKGAPLVIIGAQYQKSPFAVMSLSKTPIKTPQDMYGKRIGVQSDNNAVFSTFLKANNLDASKITKVPVQFDPLPLTQNVVDGWFSFITNEPIDLQGKGFDVTTFLLADFNYPLVADTYMVTPDALKSQRDKIKAALIADIKGWKDSLADPAAGATLAAGTYGKGLGLKADEQTLESKAQNKLISTADTTKNGIFTMTPDLITANVKTLALGGTTITEAKLFDLSLMNEIYQENPSLI